jgi:hypothetical protein
LSIVFALERTNQLSLLPDKDLVDLCPPIEPYQVTKNLKCQASFIISYNQRDLKPVEKFGISVVTPKQFLQILGEIKP